MVICDTSGRLHTNDNLMQELLKCKRALGAPWHLPWYPALQWTKPPYACNSVRSWRTERLIYALSKWELDFMQGITCLAHLAESAR